MRLINQMGTVDVPYELCALSIGGMSGKATIYIRSKSLDDRPVAFADYSSEEKAIKVMEMVRNSHAKFILFQTTYQNGVLEKLTKELGENEALNIVTPIFCFPKDEEVEV